MNTRKLIALFVAAFTATAVFAKGKQDSGIVTGIPTREIRKGESPELILPPPTQGLVPRADDQANFDAFLWSPEKLKAAYQDVIVIDARTKEQYEDGHLLGAVQLHWNELVVDRTNVPQDADIAGKFAERGIDVTRTLVVYNDPLLGRAEEARLFWLLRYLGINDSYILNGGITNWKSSGGEVTRDVPNVSVLPPAASFNRVERLLMTTGELVSRIGTVNILDARSDEEYAKSRLPGAKFVWFKDFYHPDGTYLSPAETRARVASLRFNENDELVVYCQSGIRSTTAFVALQAAGFKDVRNFVYSSWTGAGQKIDDTAYTNVPSYN